MKALCWQGKHDVAVKTVRNPSIINPHDAIIRVTTAAICGSPPATAVMPGGLLRAWETKPIRCSRPMAL